jgi:bile acid acyltransferase/acyl-CoA thioester hydrolase-like protein
MPRVAPSAIVILAMLTVSQETTGSDTEKAVQAALQPRLLSQDVVAHQLQQYLSKLVPKLAVPATAGDWARQTERHRQELLDKVIFHGWSEQWVHGPLKYEEVGQVEQHQGYQIRRLRLEIIPGFQTVAILYEPDNLTPKMPAILNLNGHNTNGKAANFKQTRCINYALQGMFALNLEWLNCSELGHPENDHWMGAHLNLVGQNAAGLFHLAMRKGLDYLWQHPGVDRSRVGVTGLSGGAWQTIVLSALDDRVAACVSVSGFSAMYPAIFDQHGIGDIEYNPPDMRLDADYTHLVAMRAPKPTLLIYGAKDEFFNRAPQLKPYLFDAIRPFFGLYGQGEALAWHEHVDPGTHNYGLKNRLESYRFFSHHFGLAPNPGEVDVTNELQSCTELEVGLPKDNLTMLGLARKHARKMDHESPPEVLTDRLRWQNDKRVQLKEVIRYDPATIEHAVIVASDRNEGLESHRYYFEFDNGLLAIGTLLRPPGLCESKTICVLLQDDGQRSAANAALAHLESDEEVLTLDLLFTGDAAPDSPERVAQIWSQRSLFVQLLSSAGQRALGLETAQFVAIGNWLSRFKGKRSIHVTTRGMRSQVIALTAGALEPQLFSSLDVDQGLPTLRYLLDKPVTYQEAPDLFCRDLYKLFDIDQLVALSGARITQRFLPATSTQDANLVNRPFYGTCSYVELRLGDEYLSMHKESLAESSFRRAIAHAPQWALPYDRLVDTLVARHAYQEAVKVCQEFVTTNPGDPEIDHFSKLANDLAPRIDTEEERQ